MKISNNFFGMKTSALGLSTQRKKMNLISENIANSSTTKTEDGTPYQRQYLVVRQNIDTIKQNNFGVEGNTLRLNISQPGHMSAFAQNFSSETEKANGLTSEIKSDKKTGEIVYMPDHPDANTDGYVEMPNVNIVTEMVDMIAATRSYEANLTALNSSKQMVKDTLEI